MTNFQKKIILRAMDHLGDLTEWEAEFIDSLAKREEDYELSSKQNHFLNEIQKKLDFG